jgi:hypothetical protein
MMYAGTSYVTRNNAFRTFEWERATAMVEATMRDIPDAPP